jgi:hypothetical protein
MFKRNISVAVIRRDGAVDVLVLTPVRLRFCANGDIRGMKAVEEASGRTLDLAVEDVDWIADRHGTRARPADMLCDYDLPAEEVECGAPVDPERRRAMLRTRGTEVWRTRGRHLGHLPGDAFRIVYTHGLNRRRIKDVRFASYRPGGDAAVVRDISNRRRQQIPLALLLTIVDPRSGAALEREEDVRAFVRRFSSPAFLSVLFGTRRTPEIA